MNATVLNPSIVGQAEKAHGAVLTKVLAGTTLDEQQWITLQFADGAGDVQATPEGRACSTASATVGRAASLSITSRR